MHDTPVAARNLHTEPPPAMAAEAPFSILLVEDVTSDALLLRLALDATHMPYDLHIINRGDEVLPWLAHERKKGDHALPGVILLDLGLPRMDGFEVLAELATAPLSIRAIPIVILTGYEHFEYVRKSYSLCVPAYVTKPCDAAKIREILLRIRGYKSSPQAIIPVRV